MQYVSFDIADLCFCSLIERLAKIVFPSSVQVVPGMTENILRGELTCTSKEGMISSGNVHAKPKELALIYGQLVLTMRACWSIPFAEVSERNQPSVRSVRKPFHRKTGCDEPETMFTI